MLIPMTIYTICACYFTFTGVILPASLWKFNEICVITSVGYVLLFRNENATYTKTRDSSIAGYIKDKDLYPYLYNCSRELVCEEIVLFLNCMVNELQCFGTNKGTPSVESYPLALIRAIYQKYIEDDAEYQLNLSAKTTEK
eukprot:Pgem_evm1s2902